jgi:uncharacterized protein YabN with tetrapyrrole methylase and pyrophosphatase domain
MEELIQQDQMDIKNMDLEQMDQYWDKAKISLKKGAR